MRGTARGAAAPGETFEPMASPLLRLAASVWRFYRDGFRAMTWGRAVWVVLLVKLFVIFVVLRLFVLRPALGGLDAGARSAAVGDTLGARVADEAARMAK